MNPISQTDPYIEEIWSMIGEEQAHSFFQYLVRRKEQQIKLSDLWMHFDETFGYMDLSHAERRYWLLTLLLKGQEARHFSFPSPHGTAWERLFSPALPCWIRKSVSRPPASSKKHPWQTYAWRPELEWVTSLTVLKPEWEQLLYRIQHGLVHQHFAHPLPLAQRSIELLSNEKRLMQLTKTTLFAPGRLTLDLLGCTLSSPAFPVEEVVQIIGSERIALVCENKDAWVAAWTALKAVSSPRYGLVCLGEGASFEQSVLHFQRLPIVLDGIEYIGDLDRPGLRTAQSASQRAQAAGLPPVRPAPGVHRAMFERVAQFHCPQGLPYRDREERITQEDEQLVSWLPEDLRVQTRTMLQAGLHIPEEVLGPAEFITLWQ